LVTKFETREGWKEFERKEFGCGFGRKKMEK
jgi:hypothetical protein